MPVHLDTYMNQADAIDPSRHPDPRQSYDEGRAAALAWFVHAEAASHYTPEQASREYLDYLRAVIDAHNAAVDAKGGTTWHAQGALSVTLHEVAVMMVAFNHVALVSRTDRVDEPEACRRLLVSANHEARSRESPHDSFAQMAYNY